MITDTRDPGDTAERRWVTPDGHRLSLTYATHSSRNGGRRDLTYGGAWDGWCLRVRHPRSGVTISETYLGRTVPEAELAAALAAIDATPVATTPERNPR